MKYSNTSYQAWILENIVDHSQPTEDDLISMIDGEEEHNIVEGITNEEVSRIVLHLIDKLSPTHATLLRVKFLEDKDPSIRSLGAYVGLGKTRTNVQYHKALEAFKKLLLEEYPSLFVAYKVEMDSPVLGRPRKRIKDVKPVKRIKASSNS